MAITLRDIAGELNVSPALVSRVLNNKPGSWASEETRSRILETASRLNYQPSTVARSLATGKSFLLAVSAADEDWHLGRSGRVAEMRGLIDSASKHHYRVLVLPSMESRAKREQFEGLVRSNSCGGFCLYAEQADKKLYSFLIEHHMPFVVIGHPGDVQVPRVDQDNFTLFRDSVRWIAAQGRHRIAFITPDHNFPDTANPSKSLPFASVQLSGYRTGMEELKAYDSVLTPAQTWNTEEEIITWLRKVKPEALILQGLASTLQWKFALRRAGISWPDEILLMSHLDLAELHYLKQGRLHEGLACHLYNPEAVGEKAGQVLVNWIVSGIVPHEPIFVPAPAPDWC